MLRKEFIHKVFKTVILVACVLFRVFLGEEEVNFDNEAVFSDIDIKAFENIESIIDIKPIFILEENLFFDSIEKDTEQYTSFDAS